AKDASTTPGQRTPRPAKIAPAVPPTKDVQPDAELRASAKMVLEENFRSSDRFVRAHAIEGLANSVGAEAYRPIFTGLSDPAPVVRFASAMAVGDLRLVPAKEPLLRMLNDQDINVRVAVRYGLHRLGDTRFTRYLETTAVSDDTGVRANTVMVLGRL